MTQTKRPGYRTAEPLPVQRTGVDRAVDVGFALLLLVCGLRYFSRHELAGEGTFVLLLAIGTGASYATAVLGRSGTGPRQTVGLLLATGFWLPLTIIAPSFGWCAFALFVAVHRVLRGRAAQGFSAAIVVAVSVGLLFMSKGQDPGLVLGPFFGGLVLASAYAALDRALSEQRRLNRELLETREQLARSEREAGALAERGRVASELHDTVVQRTASALLLLETDELRPEGSSASVGEARETLRAALVETRQLLHGLADPRETAASLTTALSAQAESAGAGFEVVGDERVVPEAVAHALQRIVQESLLNARKHAAARTVRVTLTYFADEVGVDVSDDGGGFDADGEGDGFGLRAMAWRAESLGGTLVIESGRGQGTVVAAVLPAPHEGARA